MNYTLRFSAMLVCLLAITMPSRALAQDQNASTNDSRAPRLQALVDTAVQQTLARFADKQLKPDQLAVTLVDLRDPQHPVRASYRGDAQIYPASVVKLFYLVAVHRWLEDGKLQDTAELRRALRDMIVLSYNEATHYVVDLLTGTTSGPELPP
ncbi:MAG TPA: serine hydrolase, partial [Candidatus Angelobacter sp.]|nr:serine hydrolase [Candidatus Angelobacter sp.]